MKVKELIDILQKLDQEKEIKMLENDCVHQSYLVDIKNLKHIEDIKSSLELYMYSEDELKGYVIF